MTEAEAAKRGRPPTLTDGKRVTLTLDAQTIDRAKALGAGNISLGVRLALKDSTRLDGKANEIPHPAAAIPAEPALD